MSTRLAPLTSHDDKPDKARLRAVLEWQPLHAGRAMLFARMST